MKLHTKILLGLAFGAAAGILANVTAGGAPWVEALNRWVMGPIGQIFLRLLFMTVIPLVFATLSLGVAGLGDLRSLGRVATLGITCCLLTSLVLLPCLLELLERTGGRASRRAPIMVT